MKTAPSPNLGPMQWNAKAPLNQEQLWDWSDPQFLSFREWERKKTLLHEEVLKRKRYYLKNVGMVTSDQASRTINNYF